MGGWGNVLRSIGSVGNDVQNARLQNEQDAFTRLQMGLQLQELRQRIAQAGNPQFRGTMQLPGGGWGAIMIDPNGQPRMQPLVPGAGNKDQLYQQLDTLINDPGASEEDKKVFRFSQFRLNQGADPLAEMQDIAKYIESHKPEKFTAGNFLDSQGNTFWGVEDDRGQIHRGSSDGEIVTGATRAPTSKAAEKPDTQIFGGYRWQFDPEKKIAGIRDGTGQYVRLGVAKEPGTVNEENTPFKLWREQNPTAPISDWFDLSKQNDRSDANKAVSAAMAALKTYQTLSAKAAATSWITSPLERAALKAQADAALADYQSKAQEAIDKRTDAGMSIPDWLRQAAGAPPAGFDTKVNQ